MIANLVRVLLILLGALIVVPGLLGLALAGTAHQNKRFLAALGGLWTQVAFGGLGIIVHELSHLLLALVFHHQVKRVALLRIPRGAGDTQLGYVQHAWQPHSLYQRAGNLFIGIAPLLGGTALLLLLTQWLVPRLATWWLALLGLPTPGPAPTVSTGALISWLILVVNISFGAFDLSPADLTNAAAGVGPTLGAFFIFAVVVGLIWSPTTVATTMARLTLPIDGALGLALVINLSLCGILGAIHRGAQ